MTKEAIDSTREAIPVVLINRNDIAIKLASKQLCVCS